MRQREGGLEFQGEGIECVKVGAGSEVGNFSVPTVGTSIRWESLVR